MEILQQGLEKIGKNQDISSKIDEMEKGTFADSQGKTRRRNYFEPDGGLRMYDLYQYDSEGYASRSEHFSADGTLNGYSVYRHNEDDSHQYQYCDEYDTYGNKTSTGLRVKDKDGKWLYTTNINEDGTESLARYVAQYDENGNYIGWDSYVRDEGNRVAYYNADGAVSMYSEMEG